MSPRKFLRVSAFLFIFGPSVKAKTMCFQWFLKQLHFISPLLFLKQYYYSTFVTLVIFRNHKDCLGNTEHTELITSAVNTQSMKSGGTEQIASAVTSSGCHFIKECSCSSGLECFFDSELFQSKLASLEAGQHREMITSDNRSTVRACMQE